MTATEKSATLTCPHCGNRDITRFSISDVVELIYDCLRYNKDGVIVAATADTCSPAYRHSPPVVICNAVTDWSDPESGCGWTWHLDPGLSCSLPGHA